MDGFKDSMGDDFEWFLGGGGKAGDTSFEELLQKVEEETPDSPSRTSGPDLTDESSELDGTSDDDELETMLTVGIIGAGLLIITVIALIIHFIVVRNKSSAAIAPDSMGGEIEL